MDASESLPFGGQSSRLQTKYVLLIDLFRLCQYTTVMFGSITQLPSDRGQAGYFNPQGKVRNTICNSFQSTVNSWSAFLIEMGKHIPARSTVSIWGLASLLWQQNVTSDRAAAVVTSKCHLWNPLSSSLSSFEGAKLANPRSVMGPHWCPLILKRGSMWFDCWLVIWMGVENGLPGFELLTFLLQMRTPVCVKYQVYP